MGFHSHKCRDLISVNFYQTQPLTSTGDQKTIFGVIKQFNHYGSFEGFPAETMVPSLAWSRHIFVDPEPVKPAVTRHSCHSKFGDSESIIPWDDKSHHENAPNSTAVEFGRECGVFLGGWRCLFPL